MLTRQWIIFVVFVMLCLPVAQLAPNADAATALSKEQPRLRVYVDPDANRIYGRFEVSVFDQGRWWKAGELSFGKEFTEKTLDFSRITELESARIRIVQRGGGAAHIDAVSLGGAPPIRINGKEPDALTQKKIATKDFDVIDASEKTFDLEFGRVANGAFTLAARVEAAVIGGFPFQFPRVNEYKQVDENASFYSYRLGSAKGALSMRGAQEEISGREPFFKELSISGSGHPTSNTFGYVFNDEEYLYAVVDFTGDDTIDGDKDYSKLYVKTDDGVKEFKVSEANTKWGTHHFLYNDKVVWQHKYYEFRIPLNELRADDGAEELKLAFSAYGTLSLPPTLNSLNFGSVNVGSTGTGVMTIDSTNRFWDMCGYSITGVDAAMFGWNDPDNNCGGAGFSFNLSNAQCQFNATFTPTSAGDKTATFTVEYNVPSNCGAPAPRTNSVVGKPSFDIPHSNNFQAANFSISVALNGTGVAPPVIPPPAVSSFTLTVDITGSGAGRIVSDPSGIDCPGVCSATYTAATDVTLTPHPRSGSSFTGWGEACEGQWRGAPCELTIVEDTLALGRFDRWYWRLEIDPDPLVFHPVQPGETMTLTVTVTNIGNAPVDLTRINDFADPFSFVETDCLGEELEPKTLGGGGTCEITILYSPTQPGDIEGFFNVFTAFDPLIPAAVGGLFGSDNLAPGQPELISPEDGAGGVGARTMARTSLEGDGVEVTLEWTVSEDPNGDPVSYELYICENPDFEGCEPILIPPAGAARTLGGLGALGALLIGFGFTRGRRRKVIGMIAAIAFTGALMASCANSDGTDTQEPETAAPEEPAAEIPTVTFTVTGLARGTTYYWKVVATDDRGGGFESEVRSFTTAE